MDKVYKIKPLEWIKDNISDYSQSEDYHSSTPFGNYYISRDHRMIKLKYVFDDYHDEGEFYLDSVEEAKIKAEEDWHERISGALEEFKIKISGFYKSGDGKLI